MGQTNAKKKRSADTLIRSSTGKFTSTQIIEEECVETFKKNMTVWSDKSATFSRATSVDEDAIDLNDDFEEM